MQYEFEKLRVTLVSKDERMRTLFLFLFLFFFFSFFFFFGSDLHLLAEMRYFFWYGRNDPTWPVIKPKQNNHVSVLAKVSEW